MSPAPSTPPGEGPAHRTAREIEAEARAWFVDLLQTPTARKRAEFEAWRQADSAHAEAFRTIAQAWEAAEAPGRRLAEAEGEALERYLQAMDARKARRRTTQRLTGLALALLAVLGGAIWLERPELLQDMRADYVSPRGSRTTITLSDGSAVLLDAGSALAEDFTPGERHVRLLRGTAFFDVVRNETRPFTVSAAGGSITVLGTRFDVRLQESGGTVTLDHGSVSVTAEGAEAVLKPGEQVDFGGKGVSAPRPVDLDETLAWRNGRFVFYRASLGSVLQEIGRYRKGRILVTSDALASEMVSGSFSLDDTDAALAALQSSVGFRITLVAGRLTVISR